MEHIINDEANSVNNKIKVGMAETLRAIQKNWQRNIAF
jgi:hypothetical protein